MHNPKEYEKLHLDIKTEEDNLIQLEEKKKITKYKIEELRKKEKEMVKDTIGELEHQEQHERNIENSIDYFKMIEKWKEDLKGDKSARLDKLTDHYRSIMSNLTPNIQSIIYVLVKVGKPLTSKEISEDKLFKREKQITPSYISAIMNGNGMYSIPKIKSYEFEILKKNEDGEYFISNKDSDFYDWLQLRLLRSKKST